VRADDRLRIPFQRACKTCAHFDGVECTLRSEPVEAHDVCEGFTRSALSRLYRLDLLLAAAVVVLACVIASMAVGCS
jgi:hypothetical protein